MRKLLVTLSLVGLLAAPSHAFNWKFWKAFAYHAPQSQLMVYNPDGQVVESTGKIRKELMKRKHKNCQMHSVTKDGELICVPKG